MSQEMGPIFGSNRITEHQDANSLHAAEGQVGRELRIVQQIHNKASCCVSLGSALIRGMVCTSRFNLL